MGFHKSSMNIELKKGHVLTAYCARPSGEARYSELDLNDFLGVRKGKLTWGAKDFSQSADDIHLEWEGDSKPKNPILHAKVMDGDEDHESCVNLAECIKNEDGHLWFMECF
ncbi:cyanovirin-N [Penicillium brasilianum]|uniref:Cyanovirin-N n=1 Tax=Penicillium brasilianum TaxID=104259 RepID=A0A1S9RQG6_PENBI|nr:cyanovirin-N [Penicillium brasilianum]